jgi:lysyl-tRNA synthetase class 2
LPRFQNGVDLGDMVGLAGFAFRTRTGEMTLHAKSWVLLSKALRPPPEKFHGMTDVDVRYRRREVDLFSNEDVRARFPWRVSESCRRLRRTLAENRLLKWKPRFFSRSRGAQRPNPLRPTTTRWTLKLSLRIAPELFLKRLMVGGLERVFEIGRAFRNEGIDTRHNPEFTILEAYQAYTDVNGMMDLAEDLIRRAARAVGPLGERRPRSLRSRSRTPFYLPKRSVDLALPFARVSFPGV